MKIITTTILFLRVFPNQFSQLPQLPKPINAMRDHFGSLLCVHDIYTKSYNGKHRLRSIESRLPFWLSVG